ncbi:hypothetical protein ACHAXA_001039 [Cyclostephanos tholiformis]|uniref:Membrane-associated protein n=1 Tax=Cyclostephanos tholiformis TaxID=382380 RepID=A0ABD3RW92_9STRA
MERYLHYYSAATATATAAPDRDLAVGFGNLYYSTWTTFLACLRLATSYSRTEYGIDALGGGGESSTYGGMGGRGRRFRCWTVMVGTSVVVMVSAASCYDAVCHRRGDDDIYDYDDGGASETTTTTTTTRYVGRPDEYCRRAAFGVASGCVGSAIGLAVTSSRLFCNVSSSSSSSSTSSGGGGSDEGGIVFAIEFVFGTLLSIVYGFAVAYLTGEEGPGAPLGNLYYSTWMTFGLALYVAGSCFEEVRRASVVIGGGRGTSSSTKGSTHDDDDFGGAYGADSSSVGTSIRSMMTSDEYYASPTSSYYADDAPSMRSGSVGEIQVGIEDLSMGI